MTVANVSRPPSVHAPYRKSFIIPLFVFQLATSTAQIAYDIILSSLSFYEGTDAGMKPKAKRLGMASGILGLSIAGIIISHIVKFSRFRLRTRTFVFGNLAILVLSIPLVVMGSLRVTKEYAYIYESVSNDILSIVFTGIQVFFTGCLLAYAVVAWRRVNSGRALEMARPGRDVKDGGKLDGQGDAIPMV